MKKNIYILLSLFLSISLNAQDRYIDELFGVDLEQNVIYATNIQTLGGDTSAVPLIMDIYSPSGDSETERPLILIAHTGTFGPTIFNQTTTGSKTDSTVVEMAKRLARRGYVAAVFNYRLGWTIGSPDADVRLATILQAAYRGIIDARSCARFFRRNVAEEGNLYGIDPDKIGIWGIGTGGYLSMGAASLDDFGELTLDKFRDVNFDIVVDTTILGNLDGTNTTIQNLPNHVGYSSDFQFSFNAGGALGDSTWIDGNEPPMCGVHCPYDFFAPFVNGNVIIPSNGETIINVAGTRLAIGKANELGANDPLRGIDINFDPLKPLIEAQKTNVIVAQLAQQQPIQTTLGTDNFYAFNIPLLFNGVPVAQGSPWDWWGFEDLQNYVTFLNTNLGTNFDAATLHSNGLRSNPDMSAEKARRYIDTIFMLTIPRMYVSMELGEVILDVDNIPAFTVGLETAPNPSTDMVRFTTNNDTPINHLQVYDVNGKLVFEINKINSSEYTWHRNNLPSGVYIATLYFEEGKVSKKLIIE